MNIPIKFNIEAIADSMMALQVIALQKISKIKRSPVVEEKCDVYDGLRLRLVENLKNKAIF
ncbi:hypothetical protein [Nostoc sp.]